MSEPISALRRMARAASQRLHAVVQSLVHGDATAAGSLWRTDNEIDEMYAGLCRELLTYMMADPAMSPSAVQLLFCAKNVELIGDHVTNIAEAAHYLAQGQRISRGFENPVAPVE
jgi:phosphate transport system protein